MIYNEEVTDGDRIQEANVYNQHLPFYQSNQREAPKAFEEIKMQLSRLIQLSEIEPGLLHWSKKLSAYIILHGYSFTKTDHIKLINLYLAVLSIDSLNSIHAKVCFDTLETLLGKVKLITRDELIIDWRLLYHWGKLIRFHHDQNYSLEVLSNDIEQSFSNCIPRCRLYFSNTATGEILDEIRPWLCPFDTSFTDALYFFHLFLPMNLPPALHHQGFQLWLPELLSIWESVCSHSDWEPYFATIFAAVAWNNIGYIDWEPWIPQIFTRFLRSLSLPVGSLSSNPQNISYSSTVIATLIVAMIGKGSSCLQHLRDFFTAIKSFYHPSNTGDFQEGLVDFLNQLTENFLDRVCQEMNVDRLWCFQPAPSARLTDGEITEFVHCVKDCLDISLFNTTHLDEATAAFRNVAMLRPQLLIVPLIEQLFVSVDNMSEPYRFTSILSCLTRVTLDIVSPRSTFARSQTYVVPMLISVLPGIDCNDLAKTLVTSAFLRAMLMLITCVDCSSAIDTRKDLTETEKEVCLSTAKFEDFISEFLQRTFQMFEHLCTEHSHTEIDIPDVIMAAVLVDVIQAIVQQCSTDLFQLVRKKITNFLAASSFTSKANLLVPALVGPILRSNPTETLQSLLPQTCERIERIIDESPPTLLTDHKGDAELTWCLVLFRQLLQARGDTLLVYRSIIRSVFHRTVHLIHKESYNAVAGAGQNLVRSLSYVYPIESRLTVQNIDEPFTDVLPIRAWGEHVEFEHVQPHFHIPSDEEVNFACELVETLLYRELNLLNERDSIISKDERLRSLTLICSIAHGCLQMVPRIDSASIGDLSFDSKHPFQYATYATEPKFRENLRRRLIIDIGRLLDRLVQEHPDDTASISLALQIYALPSCYYGISADECSLCVEDLETQTYSLESERKNKRSFPRFLIIEHLKKQIELFCLLHRESFTEMDREVLTKLVELSINRYSDIRTNAQQSLFDFLTRFPFADELIVTRLLQLLNATDPIDHDQFKGCLYILLGNDSYFLPTKRSWPLVEQLWPAIARTMHATKGSTEDLLGQIVEKIVQEFETPSLIEGTNALARRAAIALWRSFDEEEMNRAEQTRERLNQTNVQSYENLLQTVSSALKDPRLTWHQQRRMSSFLSRLLQKRVPLPSSCIEAIVDLLIHEHRELRQMGWPYLSALCRLQKPPRIYVQMTREDLLQQSCANECHPGDRDDNLWLTSNDYKPPTMQTEWEQTCFLDKGFHGYYQWPELITYPLNRRERYSKDNMSEQVAIIANRFMDKQFVLQSVQLLVSDLEEGCGFDLDRYRVFKGLFRNFGTAFLDHFLEVLHTLVEDTTREKEEVSAQVAAEITAGILRGSKYWTIEVHEQLWLKLGPFLNDAFANLSLEVTNSWCDCFSQVLGDVDPRRMFRVIEFLLSLPNIRSAGNAISETSRWYLVTQLCHLKWRIPQVWHTINTRAQDLLFHPQKIVRERIVCILKTSFMYDVILPNGQSVRHPHVEPFLNDLRQRLHEAIDIYEKTPTDGHGSTDLGTNYARSQQAMEFIETVIELCIQILSGSFQPIKHGIVELFPQLCYLQNLVSHDENIREQLTQIEMYLAALHTHVRCFEALLDKIDYVGKSDKWHARRAAMEFLRYLIFVNLFHARPFASRIRRLVLDYLSDERLEVRTVASLALAGLYQCGFLRVTKEDLGYFRSMSQTSYSSKVEGKKIAATENLVQRHTGVLGLCAVILAHPYDIPAHVPGALMRLCRHVHDPSPIRDSVKYALAEFRRTHHDSWHEHREKFSNDQLVVLTDLLISPTYYV